MGFFDAEKLNRREPADEPAVADGVELHLGDCLEVLPTLAKGSVDLVLADPPYGITACEWDSVIPLELLWVQLRRIIKPCSAVVFTAIQPFSSFLVMSALDLFKYALVWRKSRVSHFAQAPYRFLTEHEDVLVFSPAGVSKNALVRMTFNQPGVRPCRRLCKGKGHSDHRPSSRVQADYVQTRTGYPKSILEMTSDSAKDHPTQKPVALMKYLIRTYSNPGETVLDFCMGSGTTGVACVKMGRRFIGIEKDPMYFDTAVKRIRRRR